jgi:pimeloyl-ACP methyl ester carboxylesterase
VPAIPVLRLLLPLAAALLIAPAAADAAAAWQPCTPAGYECTKIGVPLDRSGGQPGQISLSAVRARASSNPSNQAVVALAGGPGQAAIPIAESFAKDLAPAIVNRDLLVLDQRGTGTSNPLRCTALFTAGSLIAGVRQCSQQIGPARQFFRTIDSAADIEALRAESGYDKLVLYGVSYGTKVALAYAAAYPTRVAALVLDSVVTPGGPDALQRSSFAALKRVLTTLCAGSECARSTSDVVGDTRKLAAKLARKPLRGPVYSPTGKRYTAELGETGLWNVLVGGDLNPTLRAELPGSVRAALTGDVKPILRLSVRAQGLQNLQYQSDAGDNEVVFFTTTCEESATIPWTRGASEQQRSAEVQAAAKALPPAATDPFSYRPSLGQIPRICLGYPVAGPLPPVLTKLPTVPTLILDGNADLRTPVEDAAAVQQSIPGAQLVGVPHTGHSVLGTETGSCAKNAVAAFFGGQNPAQCATGDNPYSPTPRPPLSLSRIAPFAGVKGNAGRTAAAVCMAVDDARRQIIGELLGTGSVPGGIGGLRSGYAKVSRSTFTMHSYEYVPGVRVSGTAQSTGGARKLTITGSKAAHGTLKITALCAKGISGRLGGRKVTGRATARAAHHTVARAWPSWQQALAHRPRVR